jgi:hypothetical protein
VTVVGGPPQSRHEAARPTPRELLRATTTPRKLRRLLAGMVVLCLAWGAVAAWVVSQRASGANAVVSTSEPVSLDGQQIYRALSDADATAATAFLSGGLEPVAVRHRYQADIAQAASRLEAATAVAGHSAAARDLAVLSAALPVYTGEVETARADNRLGLPLGAAYLREASCLMRGTLLPAARDVSAQADAQLNADSGQATGLPLAVLLGASAILVGLALYGTQRWLSRRTHRVLNAGLLVASVAGALSLLWLISALGVARADLLQAREHGSVPVVALAAADIAALQARADESLTLIDASGDDALQADFTATGRPRRVHRLGGGDDRVVPDDGGWLRLRAQPAASGVPVKRAARPRLPRLLLAVAATAALTAWVVRQTASVSSAEPNWPRSSSAMVRARAPDGVRSAHHREPLRTATAKPAGARCRRLAATSNLIWACWLV